MTAAFDDRLVNLQVSIDGNLLTFDQRSYIIAQGTRLTNGQFGDCSIRIDNIDKKTRDYIISRTSQWAKNKTVANVVLNVGRESYGTFQLFSGAAIAGNPSQPPDISLTLRSLAAAQLLTYANASLAPQNATVKQICQQIATAAALQLDFQASQNPAIGNYHFNGSVARQIQNLSLLGIWAYIDGNTLVVTDVRVPRKLPTVIVNQNTDMIGIPEVTELGVRAIQLIRNEVKIGSPVQLTSQTNPTVNGNYQIFKLGYQIASRDNPFYWIMDMVPSYLSIAQGAK